MIEARNTIFLNEGLDIEGIDPEILPVVQALRSKGVETIGSCSGGCSNPGHMGWGAFVQVIAHEKVHIEGLGRLADTITPHLQQRLGSPVELQFISAEAWYDDPNTTSSEILPGHAPVFRLQLSGPLEERGYSEAWNIVREAI